MPFKFGDVVLVPFPFTSQTTSNSLLKFSPKQVHRNKGEALMEEANYS